MGLTQTAAQYPAPIIFGALGDALDREMMIREAIWTGADTCGDVLIVSNYDSSAILYTGLCEKTGADLPLIGLRGQRVKGIKVTDMSSGQLLIYL